MSNDLALINIPNPLQVFSTPKGLDSIIDKIEAEVKSIDRDISTAAGRDNIRSIAFKLARSKTALDKMGKELTEEQRQVVNAVNEERRRAWARMESLQEEIRKPLTDWEDAEKERVEGHEYAIACISASDTWETSPVPSAMIQERITGLPAQFEGRDWQEFKARALQAYDNMMGALNTRLTIALKQESEAAELAKLRAEEEARKQAERDAKIAADAKAEAERKAKEAADVLAAKVKEEQAAAAKREKDALEKAAKAEQDRIDAEQKAESDRKIAAEKAESGKRAAAEAAAKAERDKLAAAQEAERKATEAREADKEHKKKINNEVLSALVAVLNTAIAPEDQAKAIITALAKGGIPHVKITY